MLTLDEIKDHLRINRSDTTEDASLNQMLAAAQDHIEVYIGRTVPWVDSEGDPLPVPASLKSAALLIIGDLYQNREAKIIGVSSTDNPVVYEFLHLYRIGLGI